MIRHVVCFRLSAQDPARRREDARTVADQIGSLAGRIESLRTLSVGVDLGVAAGHWDIALVEDLDTPDDLAAYLAHPEHQRVVAAIDPLIAERAVVDLEIDPPGGGG